MKRIILLVALLGTTTLFAQTQNENSIVNDITAIQNNIEKQNKEIENLKTKIGTQSSQLQSLLQQIEKLKLQRDSLSMQIETNSGNISSIAEDLGTKIQTTETNAKESISKLDKDVEKNRLYWIIGTLITLLLGGLVYWLLGKRISSSQTDVETQIRNTKKSLEEESLKLDAQLLDIINSQLKIKETELENKPESGEKDHSLVLKVADEVTRILMNLEVMDKEIKGYKHLKKYSESILDNLKAYGYEIPQLIGMNYNSGMNMVATLEFDESVESGKQIIKRIIKPQVNFEGKMIQAAKVTVAFNE
jgi:cell division septum initiation protein DivIVA